MIMKSYGTYIFIERDPSLFGVSLFDLLIIVGVFLVLTLMGSLLFVLGLNWPGFFGIALFVSLGLFVFLKMVNKNKQPNYLLSLFSFHFLQGKQFNIDQGFLEFKSLLPENYES
jgi:hypothetical protein